MPSLLDILKYALLAWGAYLVIGWLIAQIWKPPITRDVSRLDGEEGDLDAVAEEVEPDGGPLKENHLRKVYRDKRLLPKRKPQPGVYSFRKRKRVMSADEANRLFSGTMRTRDRAIRDLLADEEQLDRYGLPLWKTEEELAAALELSVKELRHYSIHRDAERVNHYVTFAIPKRSGGERLIMAPKRRLKAIQRTLLRLLVDELPVSEHAHGFRRGRSIKTGAVPHVGRRALLRMDLKDFFPTVTFGRVRGLLVALGYGYPVATSLAVLMSEPQRQPVEIDGELFYVPVGPRHCVQGAPTSPGLCNSIALRLDRRLAGLARKFDWSYTRYADDLAFSGNEPGKARKLQSMAAHICADEGFPINPGKTHIAHRGQRQTVTGVVVNETLGLSRQERRRLRAMIHRINNGDGDAALFNHVRGKLAYLSMLNDKQAAALESRLKA